MKLIFCLVLFLSSAFAEEETVHTPKEVEEKFDPYTNDGLKSFDPYSKQKENVNVLPEAKPLKEKKGLIDGLIDGAKAGAASGEKKFKEVTGTTKNSKDLRDDSFGTVALGYHLFSTWIPSKWSASYTQNFSRYWALEGEYSKGSLSLPVYGVDIGGITEERVTLQARYFPGNSFNWSFGLIYQKGKAELGGDIPSVEGEEYFRMESFGATLGMGNRWQWENGITFGVDWFRVNQPFFGQWEDESVLKAVNAEDSSDLKKIMRAFNTLPTFVFLGIHLGYTF